MALIYLQSLPIVIVMMVKEKDVNLYNVDDLYDIDDDVDDLYDNNDDNEDHHDNDEVEKKKKGGWVKDHFSLQISLL